MDERTVLVTGAASGIGAATVRLLAQDNVVFALDRDPSVLRFQDESTRVKGVAVDVTDERSVQSAIDAIAAQINCLDGLVTCAGICRSAPLSETTAELFNGTLATNLWGTFLVIKETLPLLRRAAQPSIVAVSSELGLVGQPNLSAYCASKAAIIGLMKSLAIELAPSIRCNVVAPGPVDTAMLRGFQDERNEELDEAGVGLPMGRIGQPIEIAQVIRFLLMPESSFVTGSVHVVDGGLTAQ